VSNWSFMRKELYVINKVDLRKTFAAIIVALSCLSGFSEDCRSSVEMLKEKTKAQSQSRLLSETLSGKPISIASFQGLGDLPGGRFNSHAFAVSANGAYVVGLSTSTLGQEAFRWTQSGGMQGLGSLPGGSRRGFNCEARAVSADGSTVVGYSLAASEWEGVRWTTSTGMVGLGDLQGGKVYSRAYDVSTDGLVIIGASSSTNSGTDENEAFRWTSDGGMVGLGDLPGGKFNSYGQGVSADGLVVVGSSLSTSGPEAFRWTPDGGMVGLGDLSGGDFCSRAFAVSADGSTVVGYSISTLGQEAFRWTKSCGMQGLGDLPGGEFHGWAWAASADGSVVVGSSKSTSGTEAFIWDAKNGMRNLKDVLEKDYGLNLAGWTLEVARGISDDGLTIVGRGVNRNRKQEKKTPKPKTLSNTKKGRIRRRAPRTRGANINSSIEGWIAVIPQAAKVEEASEVRKKPK